MTIVVGDYKLVQEGATFNLIQVVESEETLITEENGQKKRTKTGKLVQRDVEMGYNMSLDSCIKKMIMNNLSEKEMEVSLKQWLNMYREEREKITQLLTL